MAIFSRGKIFRSFVTRIVTLAEQWWQHYRAGHSGYNAIEHLKDRIEVHAHTQSVASFSVRTEVTFESRGASGLRQFE